MTRLTASDALFVFFRSLFLQAGFSPQGLQTLGLLYALAPALKKLFPDPAAYQAAVERHLSPFNTHPYVGAGIVGGILFHEERVARGELPPERVTQFKSALMGPLAALGDGFFWLSLRPAVSAASAATVPWLGAWSALLFFVLYNLVHVFARAALFLVGWRSGEALLDRLARAQLPARGLVLRILAALCAGGIGAWLATRFGAQEAGVPHPWWAVVCFLLGGAAGALFRQGVSLYLLLYVGAALAFLVGALH